VVLAVLVGSCGGRAVIGGDPQLQVVAGGLPTPQRVDAMSTAVPYYIGPFDRLVIDVFGIEELSQREFQVDASGRLSFPLIGVVDAMGKTPGELEGELGRDLVRAHVRNPQVTVNLKEAVSRVITVEGEVEKPGVYPVVGRLTLMGAVATAQGTSEFAKLKDVVVFRTVGGQRYAALYNLDAIRHGAYPDPDVYASDVVMVGESRGRRLFKDLLQVTPALVTPLAIALDRLSN
jgi:polysaccharide export outer membrane protein